jgi:carboxypeptidase Taq
MPASYAELERRYAELRDLSTAQSLAGWDQEVMMPPGGAEARAHTLAALAGVVHSRTTDRSLVRLVEALHRRQGRLTPQRRRAVELARRTVLKATRIPEELARELALAESRGLETWRQARQARDWKRFAPALRHMVELKREVAKRSAAAARRQGGSRAGAARGRAGKPSLYDQLLDDYEPGATVAALDPLFARLRAFTSPLVKAVVESGVKVSLTPLVGTFDVERQRAFAREIVVAMGIELDHARLDLSTHPFCSGLHPGDVRMTGRFDPADLRGGLFGAIHEAGHGLYEQGLDPARTRSPLGGAVSMAIHESQSRLWENLIARGRPFWSWALPRLRRRYPWMVGVTVDAMWCAANAVRPSFIRVEADELTYNLHIVLRYEIERDLIEGRQQVSDLPERWNEDLKALLGIRPKHDAEGVLQDIHWAMGLFGYFPTYSLGNLYAAQFMAAARQQIRGLDGRIARGELVVLRDWLRRKIHDHDQLYTAEQLVKRVTGKPLSTEAFERHIRAKVQAIYGV